MPKKQEVVSYKVNKWRVALAAVVVIVGLIILTAFFQVAAPGLFNFSRSSNTMTMSGDYAESRTAVDLGQENAPASVSKSAMTNSQTKPTTPRQIIKIGDLRLLVDDSERAASAMSKIAGDLGGYTDRANIYEVNSQGEKAATVTIRVPADQFDATLIAIKALAKRVEKESTGAEDVSAQFTDLQSNLKNLKAEEEQYRAIMKEAEKVDDILNVASRLAEVRGRIEQVQGQINYLSRQAEMSAITAYFTSTASINLGGIVWSPSNVVKENINKMTLSLIGFTNLLIALIFALPALILKLALILLVFWVIWKLAKWLKNLITHNV